MIISIDEIKRRHRGHWFSKETMNFFKSKIETEGLEIGFSTYFITSEKSFAQEKRRFTIRVQNQNGDICNESELAAFSSLKGAREAFLYKNGERL